MIRRPDGWEPGQSRTRAARRSPGFPCLRPRARAPAPSRTHPLRQLLCRVAPHEVHQVEPPHHDARDVAQRVVVELDVVAGAAAGRRGRAGAAGALALARRRALARGGALGGRRLSAALQLRGALHDLGHAAAEHVAHDGHEVRVDGHVALVERRGLFWGGRGQRGGG
jgi:hypothetical protein